MDGSGLPRTPACGSEKRGVGGSIPSLTTPFTDQIVKNKPAKLVDQRAKGGGLGIEPSDEVCSAVVDVYSTARIEAGIPFTNDVVKCQLTPLRRSAALQAAAARAAVTR
jgi:hypothetical protein